MIITIIYSYHVERLRWAVLKVEVRVGSSFNDSFGLSREDDWDWSKSV